MHHHRCGDYTLDEGCGHVWQHSCGKQDRHKCPKCGKGPWFEQVNPHTLDEDVGNVPKRGEMHCEGFRHLAYALVTLAFAEYLKEEYEKLRGLRK